MKSLLPAAAVLLLLTACTKDAPEASLPPATQEGKNTGGCLIDGKAFVATGWPSNSILGPNPIPPLTGGFSFDSAYRVVLHGYYQGKEAAVMLYLQNDVAGTHFLNCDTQYYPQGSPRVLLSHATFDFSDTESEVYVTSVTYTGKVLLTRADLRSGIGAGTFEFTAASTLDPRKTITITQGRFDRQQ